LGAIPSEKERLMISAMIGANSWQQSSIVACLLLHVACCCSIVACLTLVYF
jgi:hypothetical protein